jgi:type VI secretion system protein ImpG
MSDELLPYYQRELAFLRKMGAEFARSHPGVAARLRLDADMVEDPHVARMVQAFAYLNARTRRKLDDEFPEISEAMLSVLCPHYLAPIPSMAIVQFALDETQADLTEAHVIDRHSVVETEPVDGAPCSFRTCYPVALWPIRLQQATFRGPPFSLPETRGGLPEPAAVIHLQLNCLSEDLTFGQLPLGSLRFFIKGQSQFVYDLYETIFNNTLNLVVASPTHGADAKVLRKDCLDAVGFGDASYEEAIFAPTARSFAGYSLLTEYFSFPEKFLFFDLKGLTGDVLRDIGPCLDLYLLLDRHLEDLERNVSRDTFQLGCSPMVNLFRKRAAPIPLNNRDFEYRVTPDERRPMGHEVYSVDRVTATSPDGEEVEYQPFYSLEHSRVSDQSVAYWHAARRPATQGGSVTDHGSEVYLSLVDLDFRTLDRSRWVLNVNTTCLNRDLPSTSLPFGGGRPFLQLGSGLVDATCLTPPTKTLRPPLGRGTLWRLISHLSLNHLSLADSENGADALREILTLYDFSDSAETRDMITGLLNVSHRRVVRRMQGSQPAGFGRGLEITLRLDEDKFVGSGIFLFGCVLERFLGQYSTINSFSKTIVKTQNPDRAFAKWPPRAGDRTLL